MDIVIICVSIINSYILSEEISQVTYILFIVVPSSTKDENRIWNV